MKKLILFTLLASLLFACKKDEKGDIIAPTLALTQPENGASDINLSTGIYVKYDEDVVLDDSYSILLNGESKTASASGKQINIEAVLEEGTTYNVSISETSVKDIAGNYAPSVDFSFTTKAPKPVVVSTYPADGASSIAADATVFVLFDEDIALAANYDIKVNSQATTATTNGAQLTINTSLVEGVNYTIEISNNSVTDLDGHFSDAISFSFRTKDPLGLPPNGIYEAENATMSAGLSVLTDVAGYSGTGYVGVFKNSNDYLTFEPNGIPEGYYNIYIGYTTSDFGGGKVCNIEANEVTSNVTFSEETGFGEIKLGKVYFTSNNNEVTITPNWTHFGIDYIRLEETTFEGIPFNIDADLATPSPSTQAVNVYNFLKDNFQQKVISGTMAAHSTNIDEATWVHDQTGKWPALTGFDFLDHTEPNQSWVKYDAPITLSSDWWANNGLVTLMWHWRDPLNKTANFYTKSDKHPDGTEFDISKITDVNSAEYAAMVADIDVIAGYLQDFEDANIPVLWRPLHEASGGWFWWGAKGAAPCKTLWQLMFDRLVNHHGLNNLIWVWTSDIKDDALDWYPGHDYVDIIGMDIYPGEYIHSSQYLKFDKIKEIFEARKIIALTECGTAPDPNLMKEFGDMWSWFMPWNGDYTRADEHNGATWWTTAFSYDYVITRDMMPDLK